MNNGNDFGSAPIRSYKSQNQPNPMRTVAVLAMTAVIIAFVVIFIMSVTGTGLFADKKGGDKPKIDPPVSTTDGGTTDGGSNNDQSDTTNGADDVKMTYIDKDRNGLKSGLLQIINEEHPYAFK